MNIANQLTFLRIVLAFLCIGFILGNTFSSIVFAFSVFIIASLTDLFDGILARKKNTITDLGKILDPIADKILIIGVFLAFLQLDIVVNAWMVSVIMLREFIITGMRLYSLNKGEVLEAKRWGKHKTVSQITAIILIFISLLLHMKFPDNEFLAFMYTKLTHVIMWYVVAVTLFSGVYYFWVNRRSIKTF